MTTLVVWLLISTSNFGNQTTLAMFKEKVDCERTAAQISTRQSRVDCVTGNALVPK